MSTHSLTLLFSFTVLFCFGQKKQNAVPAVEQRMLDRGLVNIQSIDPDISVELKYATSDNFMGRNVYGELKRAYLQPEMAKRLARASAQLRRLHPGYKLLVYDAARPNAAQYDLWNALDALKIPAGSKTMYVADPKIGSNHNFGCAIDLTITDEKGRPLDMGTRFDFFGPLAYPRKEQEMLRTGKLSRQQVASRELLRKVMVEAGFRANTTEWWHFDGMSKSQAKARYGMIP
ncbi:M15 family metallopeptidase [Dyadobacter sandarakinus]|nr:M15 family metallopeptidase [Dyadobacter sandarakinus]